MPLGGLVVFDFCYSAFSLCIYVIVFVYGLCIVAITLVECVLLLGFLCYDLGMIKFCGCFVGVYCFYVVLWLDGFRV